MHSSHWLHNLLGVVCSGKDRLAETARQNRRVRLMLESLEDRITPSAVITDPHILIAKAEAHFAVSNALAVQTATSNYLTQLISSFNSVTGGQSNGSTPTTPGQNGSLAALAQILVAISKELSSTNALNNPVSLMELQLQQQTAQNGTPPPSGFSVGSLSN